MRSNLQPYICEIQNSTPDGGAALIRIRVFANSHKAAYHMVELLYPVESLYVFVDPEMGYDDESH